MAAKTRKAAKDIEALTHDQASRKNIPTGEQQSIAERMEEAQPFGPAVYPRVPPLNEGQRRERDEDLDPQIIWNGATIRLTDEQIRQLKETGKIEIGDAQLVWRGKDEKDWSDLVVPTPPIYVQEKLHPKAIIEDLKRQTKDRQADGGMFDLFEDFNGLDPEARTEFYEHDQNWQNRMILGDSLQVMASLAEREALRGQVQCIYFDPPYGIKFNSNWQVSTRSRDVKDGKIEEITREPEQVKAFRDTWKDGIHSYLAYLRDRLTVARDLLTESGSIFVQIGDENVHRVRALMDEVFGENNFVSSIWFRKKTMPLGAKYLEQMGDYILFYAKHRDSLKYRQLQELSSVEGDFHWNFGMFEGGTKRKLNRKEIHNHVIVRENFDPARLVAMSPIGLSEHRVFPVQLKGKVLRPPRGKSWKTDETGMERLKMAERLVTFEEGSRLNYLLRLSDYPVTPISANWHDTSAATDMSYIVETSPKPVQRCILMATDPGDLVLDPTCGSGTTATVAEQWGRMWITIDTSRVALALARARLMGARYPYYYLADTPEGRAKEQQVSGQMQPEAPTYGDIRQGFVYERIPHITLKSIANNEEIDVIWERYHAQMEPLRKRLNEALGRTGARKSDAEAGETGPWEEWEIPREAGADWPDDARALHKEWWDLRISRQREIDDSIARRADVEYLYDRPYEDKSKVRVAGPFTVESLSPHRVIPADQEELIDDVRAAEGKSKRADHVGEDFTAMVLENLQSAGVQQAAKDNRITFTGIEGWPGSYIAAVGLYMEGEQEKRAGIFIGPEFGSVTRTALMAAAREANDARFDVLIACGFNFDAHASEIDKLGPLPILKAKMNPDLHMSDELKNTGAGNLFVVFGEPDIEWKFDEDGNIVVEILGIDVFDPKTGEVRSSGKDDIAAWFIDTDYNEESFFVRHAYFLGAQDPYKSLKTSLKAEIDEEAWATLYRDTSRPFPRPETGRFAVKVINHFGDEVMKVFGV